MENEVVALSDLGPVQDAPGAAEAAEVVDTPPVGALVASEGVLESPQRVPSFGASYFDPTGLVSTPCDHGAPVHPSTGELPPLRSWIRAKYARGQGCVVCQGEEPPTDLATPADA